MDNFTTGVIKVDNGLLTDADSTIVGRNFNNRGTFARGDFNFDGNVNLCDFALLAGQLNSKLPELA